MNRNEPISFTWSSSTTLEDLFEEPSGGLNSKTLIIPIDEDEEREGIIQYDMKY